MFSRTSKLTLIAVVAMLVAVVPAFAGRSAKVNAELVLGCTGCITAAGLNGGVGTYSMISDGKGLYIPTATVQSEILTHNSVYTLDTLDSLENGLVGGTTRTVVMKFEQYGRNRLPDCWEAPGAPVSEQNQAVNWSLFSSNQMSFTDMTPGVAYPGRARIDFNVRDTVCHTQVFRFWATWAGLTITRSASNPNQWEVTTNPYGEMSLMGQGGRKGQTEYYGDFRMPFKFVLTLQ